MLVAMFCLRYFMSGLEYSIILPTIVLYMRSFGGASILLTGTAISMYPLGSLISVQFVKYFYKRTKRSKEIMLVLNTFELVGNLLYSFSLALWFPLFGRLVAGFGGGFFAMSTPQVIKLYPDTHHSCILPAMHISRIVGLVVGPSLNYAFKNANLTIVANSWELDHRTFPGLIMAFAWTLMFVFTLLFVANFGIEKKIDGFQELRTREEKQDNTVLLSTDTSLIYTDDFGDRDKTDNENEDEKECTDETNTRLQSMREHVRKYNKSLQNVCSIEYLVIVLVDIVLWFSQGIFEILALYMGVFTFHWDSWTISTLFIAGGVTILLIVTLLYAAYRFGAVNELHLTVFSLVFTHLAFTALVFEETTEDLVLKHCLFGVIYALVFVTIPLNAFAVRMLFGRMFTKDLVPVVVKVSSAISWLAVITGPILSSVLYSYRTTYGAVMTVVTFFVILMLYGTMGKIKNRIIAVSKTE